MFYLINVPIIPMENRYSKQWDSWFNTFITDNFTENSSFIHTFTAYGTLPKSEDVGSINFLDPFASGIYRSTQMAAILSEIQYQYDDGIKEFGIFFHDLWFPGIEQLKYLEHMLGISIKIFGIFHAGTWDPYDMTATTGMRSWAKIFEMGWLTIASAIFVATEFHKNLILEHVKDPNKTKALKDKIKVTFLPFHDDSLKFVKLSKKENLVAFPHRLVEEKGEEYFNSFVTLLAESFPYLKVIKTHEETSTKAEFYKLLSKCMYSISFAQQETFGISMVESALAGCIPIVPDSLSYPEIFMNIFRYSDNTLAKDKKVINLMMELDDKIEDSLLQELLIINSKSIKTRCEAAIPTMFYHIVSSLTGKN